MTFHVKIICKQYGIPQCMLSLNVPVLCFIFGLMMVQWAETCCQIFNIVYQYMLYLLTEQITANERLQAANICNLRSDICSIQGTFYGPLTTSCAPQMIQQGMRFLIVWVICSNLGFCS